MKRIDKILQNKDYNKYIKKIKKFEKDREFCKHNMKHFLDVCRIAYITSLEEELGIEKELIYAAGLLHDVGRWKQYKESIPHEVASAELAMDILMDSGFSICEAESIKHAILNHRKGDGSKDTLSDIIYKADKLSRNCFCCKQEQNCNWSLEKKNLTIKI
ncbi:MAG: HD domain-containing protein [Bacillota bacterium]|nr:HD domain-containing protein [Bacillota bacterium]